MDNNLVLKHPVMSEIQLKFLTKSNTHYHARRFHNTITLVTCNIYFLYFSTYSSYILPAMGTDLLFCGMKFLWDSEYQKLLKSVHFELNCSKKKKELPFWNMEYIKLFYNSLQSRNLIRFFITILLTKLTDNFTDHTNLSIACKLSSKVAQ